MTINWNRELSAHRWSKRTLEDQAETFRRSVLDCIIARNQRLRAAGLSRDENDDPYGFQIEAVDHFVDMVFVQQRDDDEACEAAFNLLLTVDGECRGYVPDDMLYLRAGGPRVRAAMLKQGWIDGNSGGALYLHATSKVLLREYFREAGPALLMDQCEIDTLAELAEQGKTVRLFRGTGRPSEVANARTRGMSWTRDRATAERFANGRAWVSGWSDVLTCDYPVRHILAFWETSGREPEVVINPTKAMNVVAERHEYVEPERSLAA